MSRSKIVTDGGRRRHWSTPEKLRIVEETLDGRSLQSPTPAAPAGRQLGLLIRTKAAAHSYAPLEIIARAIHPITMLCASVPSAAVLVSQAPADQTCPA